MADQTFGEYIRAARDERKLSVRRAAQLAEMSEGRWRQLELGYQRAGGTQIPANPSARTVVAMAKALGIDANEALGKAGIELLTPPQVTVEQRAASPAARRPSHLSVEEAILDDPALLPEAKSQLIQLYSLLRRLTEEAAGRDKPSLDS